MVTRDIVQRLLAILNETRSRVNTLESREVALLTATQTLTNKTLTTPVIGSFTNAQHAHTDAASGGTIAHTSLTGLTTGDPHTQYILKSAYDANTILAATNDDTPLALTVGASTLVGRAASGGIAALSAGDARTVLGLGTMATEAAADYIANSLLTTQGDLIVRNATVPGRLALTVPSSPIINFLGVANGETQPTWKSASSNPGAAAAILATDASGYAKIKKLTLGTRGATNGSILIQADYDGTPAYTLLTEYSSGAIGLSTMMYQDNSNTWLSSFAYGSIGRFAMLVASDRFKLLAAPAQDVAVGNALTTQPATVFEIGSSGNVGIGTTSPSRKLHVAGTILIDGDEGGIAGTIGLTDVNDLAARSTGVGTIKFNDATNRDSSGFVKIYIGVTEYYIPVFAAI